MDGVAGQPLISGGGRVQGRGQSQQDRLQGRRLHGQTLCRFVSTTGTGRINIWQYYKNGMEIYREIDSKGTGRPDQFRWINDGGMKWGIDLNGGGEVDSCAPSPPRRSPRRLPGPARPRFRTAPRPVHHRRRDVFAADVEEGNGPHQGATCRVPKKFSATAATINAGCRFRQVEVADAQSPPRRNRRHGHRRHLLPPAARPFMKPTAKAARM